MTLDKPETKKAEGHGGFADAARHEVYHNRRHHEASMQPLAHHSASNRYLSSQEWSHEKEALAEGGDHLVSAGETPESIAAAWLHRRGQPTDHASVEREWQRIANMPENQRYHLDQHPRAIASNMILRVWTPDLGPKDMSCQYRPWEEATPNATTIVQKCGQMLTKPYSNSTLILQPGSRGALNPGSTAFVAPGAAVRDATAGSLIINAGGTYQARPGADVIEVPAKTATTGT